MSAWKTVELGDVAEFVRGINFKPDDVVPVGTPGSVACMRTKNVQLELDCSDVWGVDERFVKRGDQFLETGDILVSSANSWNLVGKCCWIPELPWRATFGGFVSVLRPHRTKAEPRFLFRWFSSDRIQTMLRSFGQQTTNISNLNTDRCLKLPLSLPSLEEQMRIAEVLDSAEALRAKRRAALAHLDTLTESIFFNLFGDPTTNPKGMTVVKLSDVTTRITDGVHQKPNYTESGLPFISVKDITTGVLSFDDCKFVSQDDHNKFTKRCKPEKNDILYTKVGATYGRPALVDTDREFSIYVSVCLIKPKKELVDPTFLFSALGTSAIKRQADNRIKGIGVPDLHLDQIQSFRIPLPSLSEQRDFSRRIAALEKLKIAHRASLAKLDALFAVLQHRAFRGEL